VKSFVIHADCMRVGCCYK